MLMLEAADPAALNVSPDPELLQPSDRELLVNSQLPDAPAGVSSHRAEKNRDDMQLEQWT